MLLLKNFITKFFAKLFDNGFRPMTGLPLQPEVRAEVEKGTGPLRFPAIVSAWTTASNAARIKRIPGVILAFPRADVSPFSTAAFGGDPEQNFKDMTPEISKFLLREFLRVGYL